MNRKENLFLMSFRYLLVGFVSICGLASLLGSWGFGGGRTPPVSNAGPDQLVKTGTLVQLDGSATHDPHSFPPTFSWSLTSIPAGSSATLSDSTIANPTFTADIPGTYEALLVVTDPLITEGDGSSTDTAIITAFMPLSKTGQTACYDATGALIDCTGTGQDGDVQTGVAWPALRFIDVGDGTVTDNMTGLIWLKDANCFGTQTWQGALDTVTDFNTNPAPFTCTEYTAAHSDWRLPNRKELLSVIDYSKAIPPLPSGHPFLNATQFSFWSSTSFDLPGSRMTAWEISLLDGSVTAAPKETINSALWPVRDAALPFPPAQPHKTGQTACYDTAGALIDCTGTGQDGDVQTGVAWPALRFIDVGDGTVTDNMTGLIWLKDANCFGTQTWQGALDTVTDFNTNPAPFTCTEYTTTHSDWRVPNVIELESLINNGLPVFPVSVTAEQWLLDQGFANVLQTGYWSSTSNTDAPNQAWHIATFSGTTIPQLKNSALFLWPVRGGQ